MLRSFDQLRALLERTGRVTVSVAGAADREVLAAVAAAQELGLGSAILVGDQEQIEPLLAPVGPAHDVEIVHRPDPEETAVSAAELVRNGSADLLMKGNLNSSVFLRGALDRDRGLRSGDLLFHLAAFEIANRDRLLFVTDGGMNVLPDLDQKRSIVAASLAALHTLGIVRPNIAILTANEMVTPKMPATVDAHQLVTEWERGAFPESVVEGPIALDVALSPDAADHKGIVSRVSGSVDLFLVPSIEVGNVLGKALIHFADARMAGVVLGATHPVVLTSRADTTKAKLRSLMLAAALKRRPD